MLIATAGHIDHGKTTLIRALTGVETDRLVAEKARGISIDLGFAYWPDGQVGFVDVPGHEKFIRTMLAGVGPVDLALLVIAATEGIMPQTTEHLELLDLLGIHEVIVVMTKTDLVDPVTIAAQRRSIDDLISTTRFGTATILPVCATTGDGIDLLVATIKDRAAAHRAKATTGKMFRMAIDKAFSVPGAGTVVSGTIRDGEIHIEDKPVLAPSGKVARVRGLQSAGKPVNKASAGMRCAINLGGIDLSDVHRGDWVMDAGLFAPSYRLAVEIKARKTIRHNTPAHLHLGSAGLACRILLHDRKEIAPDENSHAFIVTDDPVFAVTKDRFVLRDAGGQRTIGGGIVIDPQTPRRKRKDKAVAPVWDAMMADTPANAFAGLIAIAGHETDLGKVAQSLNLTETAIEDIAAAHDLVRYGKKQFIAVSAQRVIEALGPITNYLAAYHIDHPEISGPTLTRVQTVVPHALSRDGARAVIKALADQYHILTKGAFIQLPSHIPLASTDNAAEWDRILRVATELAGSGSVGLPEISHATGTDVADLAKLFFRNKNRGLCQVTRSRYLPDQRFKTLLSHIATLAGQMPDGFTVADLRDVTDIGRNLLIDVLDLLDRAGVTRRTDDRRAATMPLDDMIAACEKWEARLTPTDYIPPKRGR